MDKNWFLIACIFSFAGCGPAPQSGIQAGTGFFSPVAMSAGTKDGGGGKGVLCGSVLRTLDLYEAQEVYHLTLSQGSSDLDTNLRVYGGRLSTYLSKVPSDANDPGVQKDFSSYVNGVIMPMIVDVPSGTTLVPTEDATLPDLKPGCSFVQIINWYRDRPQIDRDPVLWKKLDPQNQTALLLHEALYLYAKGAFPTNSDDTRRIVGLLISNQSLAPIYQPLWSAPKILDCQAGRSDVAPGKVYQFYAVDEARNGKSGIAFYFEDFENLLSLSRVSAFVPGMALEQVHGSQFSSQEVAVERDIFGGQWNFTIQSAQPLPGGIVKVDLPGITGGPVILDLGPNDSAIGLSTWQAPQLSQQPALGACTPVQSSSSVGFYDSPPPWNPLDRGH